MSSKSLPKDTFFSSPIQRLCQKLEWLFNLLLTLCSNVCVYSISILIFWFSYVIELSRLRPCYLLTLFVYSPYCMFVWWWEWRMVLLIFPQPLLAGLIQQCTSLPRPLTRIYDWTCCSNFNFLQYWRSLTSSMYWEWTLLYCSLTGVSLFP